MDLDKLKFDFSPYHNIAIFPHTNADGDAVGSAVALKLYLEGKGKVCDIVLFEKIEHSLEFLCEKTQFLKEEDLEARMAVWDLAVLVDCAEFSRIGDREAYLRGKPVLCIDHHATNDEVADFNIVDSSSPATCQLLYEIIRANGDDVSPSVAEALFVGILTDTGSFKYKNTNASSFRIAAELIDTGFDKDNVIFQIFHNLPKSTMILESDSLSRADYLFGGKFAITYIDEAMLERAGADYSESGEVSSKLRDVRGVEISCLLKESYNKERGGLQTKVSLRSLNGHDLTPLASKFGGGGHKNASGFTANKSKDETKALIVEAIKELKYFE